MTPKTVKPKTPKSERTKLSVGITQSLLIARCALRDAFEKLVIAEIGLRAAKQESMAADVKELRNELDPLGAQFDVLWKHYEPRLAELSAIQVASAMTADYEGLEFTDEQYAKMPAWARPSSARR